MKRSTATVVTESKTENSRLDPSPPKKDAGSLQRVVDFDISLTANMALCSSKDSALGFLRPSMKFLEISCHGIPWLFGVSAAILISHQPHMHELLLNLFAALVFDLAVVGLTKMLFRRRRPSHNDMDMFATVSVDKFSFPSGHTTRCVLVCCFFIIQFSLGTTYSSILIGWTICVALSRVMLGRHHVSDVMCGMLIGVVEYFVFVNYVWLNEDICESIIRPIQEDLHL